MSTLSEEESWYLFANDILYMPNANSVKKRLLDAYSKLKFEEEYFKKDCFQEQMAIDVVNKHNTQLIKLIIDKLNPKYRLYVEERIDGFGKLYLWSLNLTEKIDWNCMNLYFAELPDDSQIKVFKYLFFNQIDHEVCDIKIFLNNLLKMLLRSTLELKKRTKSICSHSYIKVFSPGRSIPVLALLVQILQAKLKDAKEPIKWSQIEPTITKLSSNIAGVLIALKDFFEKCSGWLLISPTVRYDTEIYSRNGFVTKIYRGNVHEYVYKVCFYESPIDINNFISVH